MYLGQRNIRSAGRNSGSVEITLPIELAVLEGVSCHLHLRDGLALEIVLRPNLQTVLPIFEKLWALLGIGLEEIDEIGDFAEADYGLGLFRDARFGGMPVLSYADALAVHRGLDAAGAPPPRALEAFARIIESMAVVAGGRLGLSNDISALFGSQVSYLVSGETSGIRDSFARGLAERSVGGPPGAGWCRSMPLGVESWRLARSGLTPVYDQLRSWSNDPAAFAKARTAWYRACHFEAHVGATDVGADPVAPPMQAGDRE